MAAAPALAEDALPAQASEPRKPRVGETLTETNPSSVPETMCDTLAAVAARHELPADFFIRLIWQESRFNPSAVSFKGAQGIAQFMPGTARQRGLEDSFDPSHPQIGGTVA
jgi:soluble lytic murein transglycosylase-like protein